MTRAIKIIHDGGRHLTEESLRKMHREAAVLNKVLCGSQVTSLGNTVVNTLRPDIDSRV